MKQWRAGAAANSRIIVYGQSFGGAPAVKLDRELDALGIPVALSLHIDSVGANDRLIPANVEAAVNFYEREGFPIRGHSLTAAFFGTHLKMEDDPAVWVWSEVEKYILQYVGPN